VLTKIEFNNRSRKSLGEFVQLIHAFKTKVAKSNAYEIADYIYRNSGIEKLLKDDKSPEGLGRVENIVSLLDGIQEFVQDDELEAGEEGSTDRSLSAYLQTISLMTDQDQKEENPDNVTLMSVHSAKGLEFKSIFGNSTTTVDICKEPLFHEANAFMEAFMTRFQNAFILN